MAVKSARPKPKPRHKKRVDLRKITVAEAFGMKKPPEEVLRAFDEMEAARPAGSAGKFNIDEWTTMYTPDKAVDSFNEPVLNPMVAFHEAVVKGGKNLTEGNPFKDIKINVVEAVLYKARVDEAGRPVRESHAGWPMPYKMQKVQGNEAYKQAVAETVAAIEALPTKAARAREARAALIRKMKEDGFIDDTFTGSQGAFDPNQYTEFVPLTGGPFYRQLYIYDFLRMIAYAFEAHNHNPIAKAVIRILVQYAFGRGFDMRIDDERKKKAWDDHDQKYSIQRNVCQFWAKEAEVYGDFVLNKKTWKSVDPSTILDIVTDAENVDHEFYYYQSFPTAYQMYTGFRVPGEPGSEKAKASDYIVRQIPASDVLHMKINCVSNEKRGRSTLFPILGWLKRVKDLYNAQVIREWLYSSFIWDVEVKGSPADVTAFAAQFPNMPNPGTPYFHNAAVKLAPMAALESATGRGGNGMGAELLCFIATACGIPKEFLNVQSTGGGSRVQALTSAEPFTKMIEDIQSRWEAFITEMFKAVMEQNGLDYKEGDVEVLFPSVTKDTTTETLKNLALAESQGWLSKRTAAEMGAKEMNITNYDYEDEQKKVKEDTEDGMQLGGFTPLPPGGRFGADDPDGKSDIHGDGKVDLVDGMKDL